jgi:drug/metabolite transporter (DMT)-like permease
VSAAPTATPSPARTWLPAYLANALMWGSSFAFTRVGLGALSPIQVTFWRLALGAVTLGALAAVLRVRLPRRGPVWRHLVVYAALQNAVPFTLFAFGLQHVPTVLAAIINAATPLSTLAFLIAVFPEEHPTARRVAGLLTGFVGILVVVGVWQSFPAAQWQGVAACVAAIACYGLAIPYARRHLAGAPEGPVAIATAQIGVAAVLVLPVMVVMGVQPVGAVTGGVVAAMVALGALSTGVAFVFNLHVIQRVGSATASTVTYLTPIVAGVIGYLAFGERLSWNEPVGAVVVVLGIVVAQGAPRLRRRVPAEGVVVEVARAGVVVVEPAPAAGARAEAPRADGAPGDVREPV